MTTRTRTDMAIAFCEKIREAGYTAGVYANPSWFNNYLYIDLDELKRLVERVENENKYHNMERCIYIKGGEKPEIRQYCYYAECNPINYTTNVKDERSGRL